MAYTNRNRLRSYSNLAVGSAGAREFLDLGGTSASRPPVRFPEAAFLGAAISVTSMTRSSTTVTVSATSHGLAVGDIAFIVGATQQGYNGPQTVTTVADANTFTFETAQNIGSPATGTITVQKTIS